MSYAVLTTGDTSGTSCSGRFYAGYVHNAVWNDLVDAINIPNEDVVEYGYCYAMSEDGHYHKTNKYMEESFIGLHSDTAGFIMGEDSTKNKLKVSACGFVLAYVDKEYPCGTPLTCTEGGILTEIKKEDIPNNPHRIIATYWKSESQEKWGLEGQEVDVNGRKWVKIR